jgi:ankyrin repeat protein
MADQIDLRGVAMIEKIITGIENGTSHIKIPVPQPIEKGKLEKLMFDKGVALPPSLKRFLEFDASWLATDYGLFDDLENPVFQPVSVAEALRDGLMDENFWQCFKKLPKPLPQAKCITLDCGCETMRILFLGKPDKNGEYAVLDLDIDDMPSIYLAASSFDIWLARQAGLISDPSTECKKDMDDCAKRLFGKADWLECDYYEEDEDEDKEDEDEGNEDEEDEKPTYTKKSVKGIKFSPEQLAKLDRDKMIKAIDNASENNDADTAWVLYEEIKKRFRKDQKCLNGALVVCGFNDFAPLIQPLLDIGASADAKGHYGSVLNIACVGRSFEIFKILVDAGADLNWSKKEEDSPIASAAEHKNVDKVKYLLEHGAKPNPNAVYEAISQFHKAKIENTIEIITLLLNADPKLVNNGIKNWHPIIKAVNERNLEIVKLLIERGADPNGCDYKSNNALQEAWSLNIQDIFDYLITTNVSRTHKNEQGWSIDDLFDETCKYPKVFNVSLYETEKAQHISLKLKYIFRNPYQVNFDHLLDAIKFIERLVNGGLAGSDKYAPDSSQFEWKSKLPKENNEPVDEIKVEFVVKGICESTFNIWLLEFFNQDYGIAELELIAQPIANEKIVVDTEKVKKWLDTKKPAPIKLWPAIPFPITEAMASGRICMFQHEGKPNDQSLHEITCLTREIIKNYEVKVIKGKYGNEIIWVDYKQSGKKTIFEHRFLIGSKNKEFNCDIDVTRAIVLNALIRYHQTNPIQSLEWSLGITGKVSELTAEKAELETYGDEDKIEISPSARAACKGCKQKIDKGILRFAYTNDFFQQNYFHLECATKKHGERLKASIKKFEGDIPNKQDLLTKINAQKAAPKKASSVSVGTYPYAESAKTSRSKCIKCGQTIEKATLRIAVEREFEIPTGGMMTGAGYLHIGCAKDYEGVTLNDILDNSQGLDEAEILTIKEELN